MCLALDQKLQRSFSRKVSQQRGSEKKINSSNNSHEGDNNFTSLGSPRGKNYLQFKKKERKKIVFEFVIILHEEEIR